MFATLAGGYPATDPGSRAGRSVDALVRDILAEQADAGLGLLTDGSLRWPDPLDALGRALIRTDPTGPHRAEPLTVAAWTFAADAAEGVPVKQCLPGPYSLGRRFAEAQDGRSDLTLAFADALAVELVDLAAAGCPFIQVDEDAAVSIGRDPAERALFREAQTRLLAGLGDDSTGDRPHVSLAISGGNADAAGPDTIFSASYDSYLFDLIAGPENWRLVTVAPAERGIVLGVADARSAAVDEREVVVWAVGYAAASRGRGEARVGIAPSGSLAGLPRAVARAKIERLGEVVRLIDRRAEEPIEASLDPRAIDARSAALGRWTPPEERYPRQVQAQRRRSR
jgi:methionine synthase II (cobalamin-independent)